jgi:hypothetical protein
MKITFLLTICSFLFTINCQSNAYKQASDKVTYDPMLKDSFFLTNTWSYPSFTSKDDDGKFAFMTDDKDTTHFNHTAHIFTAFDSLNDNDEDLRERGEWENINFGKAYLVGNSILLKFESLTPSSYDDLTIKIKNGQFFSIYLSGSPPIGNRYYDFEKLSLTLQKETYTAGDTIKGYLDFFVEKPKYAHLKGAFKCPVLGKKSF